MSTFPVVIHHNPDCGTSRNVLGIIQAAGYEPTVIDYPVLFTRGVDICRSGLSARRLVAPFASR